MNRKTMLLGAALLVLVGSACPSEKTPQLELVAPKLQPGIDVSGWSAPAGEAPARVAWPTEGASYRIVLTEEVEQRAPQAVELHAKVEIEADVRIVPVEGGLAVTVTKPDVKLTPPIEGRVAAITEALEGATGTIHTASGSVSFTPADRDAHIREILSAIAWLLPPGAGPGHAASEPWTTTLRHQMPGLASEGAAKVEATSRVSGADGKRLAIRTELALTSTGALTEAGATGTVTGEGKGEALAVLEGDALVRADVALNQLAVATIRKGSEELAVQQLVRLGASLERQAQ